MQKALSMQNALSVGATPLARIRYAVLVLAAASFGLCLAIGQAAAQNAGDYETIEVNTGKVIHLPRPATEVFVANPDIADVQVNSPNTVYVYGRSPGETSIFAVGAGGKKQLEMNVLVTPDLRRMRADVRSVLPGEQIDVRALEAGIALTGSVSSPTAAANAMAIARTFMGEKAQILNLLSVRAASQVSLRVRVAEVSRQVSDRLGVNWQSIIRKGNFMFGLANGRDFITDAGQLLFPADGTYSSSIGFNSKHVDLNAMIDALQSENLVTILAEPNLTAVSGQTASFLAGGEFPVPVAQENDRTTIEFKEFGVRLSFTPTILDTNLINLKVRPEVSQLTDEGAIIIDELRIPALATRRAETTVELGSGQSFVVAGLLQNNLTTNVDRYPGLGNMPILGALFRSQEFRRNQSELVIIVTPYVVRPVNAGEFSLPQDGLTPVTQGERIFKGELWRPNSAGTQPMAAPVTPTAAPTTSSGFIVD